MAEGFFRRYLGSRYEVHSAGTKPVSVRPEAIEVMREIGIDITGQRSKSVSEYLGKSFSYVITVCDSASETCPVLPGLAKRIHWSFEDPAASQGAEEERKAAFRRVRDQIEARIRAFASEQSV
jgi:arsenate reductase